MIVNHRHLILRADASQGRTWRGLRNPADSPIASSMYFLSSGVIVGWAAGLSYDTRIQNMYQNIPKLPKSGARHQTYRGMGVEPN